MALTVRSCHLLNIAHLSKIMKRTRYGGKAYGNLHTKDLAHKKSHFPQRQVIMKIISEDGFIQRLRYMDIYRPIVSKINRRTHKFLPPTRDQGRTSNHIPRAERFCRLCEGEVPSFQPDQNERCYSYADSIIR